MHSRSQIAGDICAAEVADKSVSHAPTFNGNPDCIITSFIHEADNGVNIGYGEAKPLTTASPHIIYYIIQLKADGLYTMTESLIVECPMSISELSGYVANLSQLKEVLVAQYSLAQQ
ncbi:hypothetical protein BDC45DRAFT_574196 [Circinella umbellata]|nr:hypothetical protein BDC45DRAFT_574196 [Circinella umbellata]